MPSSNATYTPLPPAHPGLINDVLPPEILSTIFETLVELVIDAEDEDEDEGEEEDDDDSGILWRGDMCGLVLSHVCSHWRSISLDTPSLWKVIAIDESTPIELTDLFFERSKSAPVDVVVDFGSEDEEAEDDERMHALAIITYLLVHMHHIRLLEWSSNDPKVLEMFLSALEGTEAPVLERLSINDESVEEQEHDGQQAVYKLFTKGPSSVPKLLIVELWSIPVDWSCHPFENLHKLELCYLPDNTKPTLEQLLALLRSSPTLQTLNIHNGVVEPERLASAFDAGPRPSPVSLPALKHLTLRDFDAPSPLNNTIRLIDAPNLVHLNLSDLYIDAEGEMINFQPTFELLATPDVAKNLKSVESLKLAHFNCADAAALEDFICSLSNLRSLHVVYVSEEDDPEEIVFFGDHYFRAFLPPAERRRRKLPPLPVDIACPLLEDVTTSGFPGKVLHRLALARAKVGKPLKTIIHNKNDDVDMSFVEKLSNMGISVEEYSQSEDEDDDEDEDEDGEDE